MTSLRHLEAWKLRGRCATYPDPELWFAEHPAGVAEAKSVCAGCLVRDVCLDDALARGEAHGVLGGLTPAERRAAAAGRGLPRPSIHGATQHGQRSGYVAGCRCPDCRRGNSVYMAGWRAERRWSVTTGGLLIAVLDHRTGRGRTTAWPGQLYLPLPTEGIAS
ncbi:WhiB family transcriptional regulator [Blastococcus mobilis]|uniref:Transcriptional regulator WhiB n=1 Tax=Blastococcus mobilis TaxID=1938746 RepID=A0A238VEJ8_9ACTN|nr:WhiB family transcriptional regulator [Blastococcus mobilis]SNR32832.1 Transcription factor WhiB [Blastococcus mobilis]